jgi:hypothetical protein
MNEVLQQHHCEAVSLYGVGRVGKLLLRQCDGNLIRNLYDNGLTGTFAGREMKRHNCVNEGNLNKELLLITVAEGAEEIKRNLAGQYNYGYIMTMDELFS